MFLYQFSYGSYEESESYEFMHDKKFTHEEYDELIMEVCADLLVIKLIREYESAMLIDDEGKSWWMDMDDAHKSLRISVQDLFDYSHVVNCMKKHGFSPVEYTAGVNLSGWSHIVAVDHVSGGSSSSKEDDWGADEDGYQQELHKYCREHIEKLPVYKDMMALLGK